MTPETFDVLLVAQPASYGVATCVRQLTKAAVSVGHRVTVACPGPEAGPLAAWVLAAGAAHHELPLAREPALRDAWDIRTLRRLASGRDLVHLHSSKAAALGRAATASLGRSRPAVVVTPHYWSWLVGGPLAPVYRGVELALAPFCDAIVAVSEIEAAEGERALFGAAGRITLIANGVDRDRFSPEGPEAERDRSVPLLVCAGRLSAQKGQDVAIRALARMRHREARLRFVGSDSHGESRARLLGLASSLGVAERLEWRGHVRDAAPELRAADVVVAPSRWEGMSLVLLEALACGAPTVATTVSGSEAVGDAGVLVPPDDPRSLADAVDELLDDPARLRLLSLAARERSVCYGLAHSLQRNLDLWARVVRARKARR